jgi:hypothetical protein
MASAPAEHEALSSLVRALVRFQYDLSNGKVGWGGWTRTKSAVGNAQVIDSLMWRKIQKRLIRFSEVRAGHTELPQPIELKTKCSQVPAPVLVFPIGYSMADGRVMPEADERLVDKHSSGRSEMSA